jgi:hypothetical protein
MLDYTHWILIFRQEDEGEMTRRTPNDVEETILKSDEPENQKAMSIKTSYKLQ